MAQIKETIELLTKILRYNGTSKIKSEIFRQAKFDRVEAAGTLWRLLFEIIYYLKYRKIDDITIKAYSQLSKEELCIYVKTEMKMRGFVSRNFHELPSDMSDGSRELLLAFGWLMCRSGLIDLFMEQCCTFLDGREVDGDLDKLSLARRKAAQQGHAMHGNAEIRDKIAYLMWLNGKLRMSLRNVHTLQSEKERLTEQVHQLTQGVTVEPNKRDHLTVLEVMMLKNPELLKKNLKLLEADNQRLESLIAWQKHDDIFWKWMESVLDAKIADSGLIEEIDHKITPRTQATKEKLDCKLQLAEAVRKYEVIVHQLEQDIITQKEQKSTTMEDIDAALAGINSEISSHLDILLERAAQSRCNGSVSSSVSHTSSSALEAKPRKMPALRRVASTTSSITSATVAERQISDMETELSKLRDLVGRLQSDIQYKQTRYQDDLSSVTSGMESLYEYINNGPVHFQL